MAEEEKLKPKQKTSLCRQQKVSGSNDRVSCIKN